MEKPLLICILVGMGIQTELNSFYFAGSFIPHVPVGPLLEHSFFLITLQIQ